MNLLVLISGIADPRRPATAQTLQDAGTSRVLSPFDESALECALKLRDADPATVVHAVVACSAPQQALLRSVAAFRLDSVRALAVDAALLWDAQAFAARLAAVVSGVAPRVALMGREFGDFDDGVLAPCLAEALGWPYVGLAQVLSVEPAGGLTLLRERGGYEERIRARSPVLASITNDKSNRLRHPLMKNIAAAMKQQFTIDAMAASPVPVRTRLQSMGDVDARTRSDACRMLEGDVEAQAAELARLLKA